MKQSFKNILLVRLVSLVSITLLLCATIFSFFDVRSLIADNNRMTQKITLSAEDSILQALDSVKGSSDLLGNTLPLTAFSDLSDIDDMDTASTEHLLEELIASNPFIKRASIINTDGMQIAKFPNTGYSDVSDRDYFKQALSGKSNFSPVIISSTTGQAIITYATPLIHDGKTLGVLATVVEVDSLQDLLVNATDGINCSFGLLDSTGSLLLTNETNSLLLSPEQQATFFSDEKTREPIDLSNLEPVKAVQGEKSGSGSYVLQHTKALTYYESLDGYSMDLLIAMPYTAILKSILTLIGLSLGILIVICFISIFAVYQLTNSIIKPIVSFSRTLQTFASGNLTVCIDDAILNRKDEFGELGKSFTAFSVKIKSIISELQKDLHTLKDYSDHLNSILFKNQDDQQAICKLLTDINTKMSTNTQSLSDTLMIFEDFSHGTQNVSLNLNELNQVIAVSTSSAKKSSSQLDKTATIVHEAQENSYLIRNKMQQLSQVSSEISNLTETITKIAHQTNLLALNAAIEAARSGEHGKGFTIVADEVKKLAEQTASASADINNLLTHIQSEITSTATIVNTMHDDFQNLVKTSTLTVDLMNEVTEKSLNSQTSVEEITAVIEEQIAGIENGTNLLSDVVAYIQETSDVSNSANEKLDTQLSSLKILSQIATSLDEMSSNIKTNLDYFKH